MEVVGGFLLRRLPAAISGGFFIDKHIPAFANISHAITWITFLVIPIGIFYGSGFTESVSIGFPVAMGLIIGLIKTFAFVLHRAFDKEKKMEEETELKTQSSDSESKIKSGKEEIESASSSSEDEEPLEKKTKEEPCLLYTSPSPRDA
eukprot:TRINITY_DN5196_c0_g1_i2.p1 TRINITY_DN5196_c0_g1~~TRINITY_DN5196_c0_g1_i2.p1  ORF type:complete len:148 (+),score=35.69 TRINITY_DN5196_c0_g1_i2:220-663(+)